MKTYKIGVNYEVYGYIYIDAENIDEALEKANDPDIALPDVSNYVYGTWEVDEESAYFLNE